MRGNTEKQQDSDQKQYEGPENEIRVSGKTNVLYAVDRVENAFKSFDFVVLSGINTGISKLLLLTEICKIKFEGLHQYNLIETLKIESQEGGNVEDLRYLTRFKVELHKNKPKIAPKGFYQAPYTSEEVEKIKNVSNAEREDDGEPFRRGGFRGRYRGRGRGRGEFRGEYRGRGRGEFRGEYRGRGRGRGEFRGEYRGRGRGRGRDDFGGEYRRDDFGGEYRRDDFGGEYRGRGRDEFGGEYRGRGRGEFRGEYRGRGRGEGRGEYRGRGRGRGEGRGRGYYQQDREVMVVEQPQGQTASSIPGLGGKGPKSGPAQRK